MKRLLFLLLAAGGAAWWWRNRSSPSGATGWTSAQTPEVPSEPPRLGGEVDPELLAILACPLDKQPVSRQGNYLVCQECQRHYPIRDGIPVMLIDEALTPEQAAGRRRIGSPPDLRAGGGARPRVRGGLRQGAPSCTSGTRDHCRAWCEMSSRVRTPRKAQ